MFFLPDQGEGRVVKLIFHQMAPPQIKVNNNKGDGNLSFSVLSVLSCPLPGLVSLRSSAGCAQKERGSRFGERRRRHVARDERRKEGRSGIEPS